MKLYLSALSVLLLSATTAFAQTKQPAKPAAPAKPQELVLKTHKDSVSYFLGLQMAMAAVMLGDEKPNVQIAEAAMKEYLKGSSKFSQTQTEKLTEDLVKKAEKELAAKNLAAADKFMKENEGKPGISSIGTGGMLCKEVNPPANKNQAEIGEASSFAAYDIDITLKLQDGNILYKQKNLWLNRYPRKSFLPYDIDACLSFSKDKHSYIYYIHPSRAYGRKFTYEDSLFRIVPPNSLIICELKVNSISEEELKTERSHDWDMVEMVTDDPPVPVVEEMPVYPGEQPALMKDIMNNLIIPQQDIDAGITGTFYVSFIVEKDGSVSDANIKRVGKNSHAIHL